MNWQDHITVDPGVLVGKPVIKGTRIAVEFIVNLLSQGWTESEVLEDYPGLTHDNILACLKYAGEILQSEKVYPLKVVITVKAVLDRSNKDFSSETSLYHCESASQHVSKHKNNLCFVFRKIKGETCPFFHVLWRVMGIWT